jgi:hypothetical protein
MSNPSVVVTLNREYHLVDNHSFRMWEVVKVSSTQNSRLVVGRKMGEGVATYTLARIPKNRLLRIIHLWYYKIKDFYLVP